MCFHSGKYGHQEFSCPTKKTTERLDKGAELEGEARRLSTTVEGEEQSQAVFGLWMVAQKGRKKLVRGTRWTSEITNNRVGASSTGEGHGKPIDNSVGAINERSKQYVSGAK